MTVEEQIYQMSEGQWTDLWRRCISIHHQRQMRFLNDHPNGTPSFPTEFLIPINGLVRNQKLSYAAEQSVYQRRVLRVKTALSLLCDVDLSK